MGSAWDRFTVGALPTGSTVATARPCHRSCPPVHACTSKRTQRPPWSRGLCPCECPLSSSVVDDPPRARRLHACTEVYIIPLLRGAFLLVSVAAGRQQPSARRRQCKLDRGENPRLLAVPGQRDHIECSHALVPAVRAPLSRESGTTVRRAGMFPPHRVSPALGARGGGRCRGGSLGAAVPPAISHLATTRHPRTPNTPGHGTRTAPEGSPAAGHAPPSPDVCPAAAVSPADRSSQRRGGSPRSGGSDRRRVGVGPRPRGLRPPGWLARRGKQRW